MRIGQKSFIMFASKLVGSALGFVATIYFARELGAEILGYYASVLAIIAWLRLVGDFGVGSAMKKRISEGEEPGAYFVASVILIGGLGIAIASVVLVADGFINAYVGAPVAGFIAGLLLIELFYISTDAALEGERRVHIVGLLSPVKIGSRSAVQIALVFAGFSLYGMLAGYAVGGVLVGVIGLAILSVGIERPKKRHFESLVDFAKFSWLGRLQTRTFNEVDILVLTALVPSALVGVYSVAWSITKFLTLFGSAISSTLFPELSRADTEGSGDTVSTLVSDAVAYNGLLIIPGLFGGGLLASRLLRIYGPEFIQGGTVLWVLILAALVYGYQEQFLYALNALDRPDIAFRVNAVFIITNVVLNIVLVVSFGVVGAAVATTVSASVGLVLSYFALQSLISFTLPVLEVLRQFLAAIVMAATVYLSREWLVVSDVPFDVIPVFTENTIEVVLLVCLGGAAYFLALLALSPRFRATVTANIPN